MRNLRTISAVSGFVCLAFGLLGWLSNPTKAHNEAYGHTFLIAGAIIIAAVLISSAISEGGKKQ